MAAHKSDVIYTPVSEHALLAAVAYVAQQGDYEIKGFSNEMRETLFDGTPTGDSPGRTFAVSVAINRNEPGSAALMSVGRAERTRWSFSDGEKNQAALDLLAAKVKAALAAPESSRPQPIESFARLYNGTVVPWTSGEFPDD